MASLLRGAEIPAYIGAGGSDVPVRIRLQRATTSPRAHDPDGARPGRRRRFGDRHHRRIARAGPGPGEGARATQLHRYRRPRHPGRWGVEQRQQRDSDAGGQRADRSACESWVLLRRPRREQQQPERRRHQRACFRELQRHHRPIEAGQARHEVHPRLLPVRDPSELPRPGAEPSREAPRRCVRDAGVDAARRAPDRHRSRRTSTSRLPRLPSRPRSTRASRSGGRRAAAAASADRTRAPRRVPVAATSAVGSSRASRSASATSARSSARRSARSSKS